MHQPRISLTQVLACQDHDREPETNTSRLALSASQLCSHFMVCRTNESSNLRRATADIWS